MAALEAEIVIGLLAAACELGSGILVLHEVELVADLTLHHLAKANDLPAEAGHAGKALYQEVNGVLFAAASWLSVGVMVGKPERSTWSSGTRQICGFRVTFVCHRS
jgi:hypothetical protein